MGRWPTPENENPRPCEKPALSLPKGEDLRRLDSRSPAFAEDKFRGKDERRLIFRGAQRGTSLWGGLCGARPGGNWKDGSERDSSLRPELDPGALRTE